MDDDEYRATALRAMVALRADLHRALHGAIPNRSHAREIGADLRRILAESIVVLGEADVDEFDDHVEAARAEVLAVFGTSGWGGP
jgi:hypothetical protein